jgi:hypothetical protein
MLVFFLDLLWSGPRSGIVTTNLLNCKYHARLSERQIRGQNHGTTKPVTIVRNRVFIPKTTLSETTNPGMKSLLIQCQCRCAVDVD